jgi:diguanylate cyclase (GGDEF)-like protein
MSAVEFYETDSVTERLLERSWAGRDRRASERELIVDATAAALFSAVAGLLLLGGSTAGLRLPVSALLVAVYALVCRIEFPVGAGYVVPTQLILVPMLLILPPAVVPAAVGAGMVIGNGLDWAFGRVPPRRVLSALPDAWHAVGPAAVLLLAGSPRIGFAQLPLFALAFGAGCLIDLISSLVRMRLAGVGPTLRLQLRVIWLVWAVDACLAPLGFLAGIAARGQELAILFVLPLVFLLWLLARDRSQRIEKAHQRLKLVEQERVRLQSAVRRLGDAFVAKLELGGLLEILLHGSIEALDAAAGRLELAGGESPVRLSVGADGWLDQLASQPPSSDAFPLPVQMGQEGVWRLTAPVRIAAAPRAITGSLWLVRAGRSFEEDEVELICELIEKAELAAAEIIANQAIRDQAMTDPLTGLGNRRRLAGDLATAVADAEPRRPSVLLLFDLDGFKNYNDTFGHLAGDELLTRLGGRLRHAVERLGMGRAYRLGGDEFCAHLELDGADLDAVIGGVAAALTEVGADYAIEASLGVVLLPQEADSAPQALRLADERMYANKRGRAGGAGGQAGEVLLRTLRAKQPELTEHSSNVAALATKVARRLGLTGEALDEVVRAAQLHDVGKVGIPDAILNKSSRLSDGEWEFIRDHTIFGERILQGASALRAVAQLVRSSHERWDGSGYPDRLCREQIPLGARIVSVCDAYDAMTTERTYRSAVPPETACHELRRCAGAQFDPEVVEAFLAVLERGDDERELNPAQTAAAHVRSLLAAA